MEEEEEATPPRPPSTDIENPDPLLGFITVNNYPNYAFRKYIWNSAGNSYEYSGSSMSTFSTSPRRGEMNNRRIYILTDNGNNHIGFYDLSFFGRSPVIKSQSGYGGHWGSCGFMDENIVVCATHYTGDIYKYNITNNYEQVKIADNNPSGKGFASVLVTKEKHILAAYSGCIYIYNSSGAYIGYSDNSQRNYYMLQMKEIRENIILAADGEYVYSHDISNTGNIIKHKLLDYDNTKTRYYTLEVLEGNTGDIAIGGFDNSSGNWYGYVELFHLDEDNSALLPISNKRWVGEDTPCLIFIIREIQTGVIIFGGNGCDICTWEYALLPNKYPICFPLGGLEIYDIISLP